GYVNYVFFFFFQAEDGIRDKLVTGVQTCALPIWHLQRLPDPLRRVPAQHSREQPGLAEDLEAVADAEHESALLREARDRLHRRRSEERRVGKECSTRWWRGH